MRTEQQALRASLVALLVLSGLGISFGLWSGSSAIIFDGVFSLVDAVMSVVSIVVSGLIIRSTANRLPDRVQRRFTMGFWHFEPIVLAVNALLMMSVAAYALTESVAALLSGGRDVEFGPAVAYAAIVLVLTMTIGILEHRANRSIGSALVAIDVKGWLMAGGVTGALLVAFGVGFLIDGTRFDHLMPYVDPAILAIVATVLIPVPIATLRKAVGEIALVTPAALQNDAETIAGDIVRDEGFRSASVHVSQTGRARQVEIVFYVPTGWPARPLEDWDRIRGKIEQRLGEDPHDWIMISFTTTPERRKAPRTES